MPSTSGHRLLTSTVTQNGQTATLVSNRYDFYYPAWNLGRDRGFGYGWNLQGGALLRVRRQLDLRADDNYNSRGRTATPWRMQTAFGWDGTTQDGIVSDESQP
jgi:hypothetical protein